MNNQVSGGYVFHRLLHLHAILILLCNFSEILLFIILVTESIPENISRLIQCLDVDNGLADCLFSRGVLSLEQYERLTNKSFLPSSQEQNRELLTNMLPSRLKSISACKMFMAALVETDQRHIFNFIMNSTGLLSDVQCFLTIL